mmetsp:Transcript_13420/g.43473  ORF Transcript_13420/g.43473 Transcript_13420/m.43473 type:complete len:287 (-) Transcript_13420:59-919(-)
MQAMERGLIWVLVVLALARIAAGVSVRKALEGRSRGAGTAASGLAARVAEWRSFVDAEEEDKRFWGGQWPALEADLHGLQQAAAPERRGRLSGGTGAGGGSSGRGGVGGPASRRAEPAASAVETRSSPAAAGGTSLASASTTLRSLCDAGKGRIEELEAREKDAKRIYDDKRTAHQQRVAQIEERFANGTFSAAFRANETRQENHLFDYWERVRERQRVQYTTSLKVQQGLLARAESMLEVHDKTTSGKVVSIREQGEASADFCEQALAEVHAQKMALRTFVQGGA